MPEEKIRFKYLSNLPTSETPNGGAIRKSVSSEIDDAFAVGMNPEKLIQEMKSMLPEMLGLLKDSLENKYSEQYETLKKKRLLDEDGAREIPPLSAILANMMLDDETNADEAMLHLREQFGQESDEPNSEIIAILDDEKKHEELNALIHSIHSEYNDLGIAPFELGNPAYIGDISAWMKRIQAQLGPMVDTLTSRMIFEKLSDWGYLGTMQDIKDVSEKLKKLNETNISGINLLISLWTVLIAVGCSILPGLVSNSSLLMKMGAILAIVSSYWYAGFLEVSEEGENSYKAFIKYPYNKPKQIILKKRLENLTTRDESIKLIEGLMKDVSGFTQSYEDLDSIESDDELKVLAKRLGTIKILMQRRYVGGKKYPYEFFIQQGMTDEILVEMMVSLHEYDKIDADKQIEGLVDIMTRGSVDTDHIEKVRAELLASHQAKNDIILPSDIVEVSLPTNPMKAIDAFDTYMKTLDVDRTVKEEYERLKDTVTVSENIHEDIELLATFVKTISEKESRTLDPHETREALREYIQSMGLSPEQEQYFYSLSKLGIPSHDSAHTAKDVALDLESFIKDLKKPEILLREVDVNSQDRSM